MSLLPCRLLLLLPLLPLRELPPLSLLSLCCAGLLQRTSSSASLLLTLAAKVAATGAKLVEEPARQQPHQHFISVGGCNAGVTTAAASHTSSAPASFLVLSWRVCTMDQK